MSLHPIKALDHVIDEYADYLRTEFRAKDPTLQAALEAELDAPGFLAQEPFYQAHRPFKSGTPWRQLPIDVRLAQVMEKRSGTQAAYLHQADAIAELLSPAARPVVVTTGTGSGKTEAFLLPVIENAWQDAAKFNKSGLTAILVYPMNALANDQELRINQYLEEAGMAGAVTVAKYDRGTSQADRERLRKSPPHILLTNYMMLEYLLVRPADREDIFANHRCRFLVLDEVHTYRGTLGSNIALLVRRLKVHLARARQEWRANVPDEDRARRYPTMIPVGTSATIKTVAEEGLSRDEMIQQRDAAVQQFFATLTGAAPETIRVLGEELQEVQIPDEAVYPARPGRVEVGALEIGDVQAVRQSLCRLAGLPADTPIDQAARRYRLLWDLNRWLTSRPMSTSQIVAQMKTEVADRKDVADEDVRAEIEAALVIGAALPDGTPGALRLRTHRFIRGGWQFHRCLNPACGKLYAKGEEHCTACHHPTAPLYLCRNCGADYLRLVGDREAPLRPSDKPTLEDEWLVYDPARFEGVAAADEDEEDNGEAAPGRRRRAKIQKPIKKKPILDGSLDPRTLQFSSNSADYPLKVTLLPARTQCLCCGGTAGSRNVITPVSLGTSAAVKVVGEGLVEVLAEANRDRPGHDGKERLLVFSDSRQDAAHQARFIIFASRYDRMRSRLLKILQTERVLTLRRAVEMLADQAVSHRDNPHVPQETDWIPDEARQRIQAWEEAPLLDEIAVNAGYRGTLVNLGLIHVAYHQLDEYVRARGGELTGRLGIKPDELEHLCRVVLDEMRTRGCLSREMLRYHTSHVRCPEYLRSAEWERRVKQPRGYATAPGGTEPVAFRDGAITPGGITCNNAWRKPKSGGRGPSLEQILKQMHSRIGGNEPSAEIVVDLLAFLKKGSFLVPVELFGYRDRDTLLQINSEIVRLELATERVRMHCEICGKVSSGSQPGMPCPRCHGSLVRWLDAEVNANRSVKRIKKPNTIPLVAGEHTAQITTADRATLEDRFKASQVESPVNVLACSPTLEMGIDVGGLDAVIMRNVPPRPDNYAQRGGRAGRRSRVGLVLGYARSTPHDQYFYDKPREMIAGEVPAPAVSLGNQDVLVRHLCAIAFGAASPGLAGKMVEYVAPSGAVNQEAVNTLIEAVRAQSSHALTVAREAWGADVLSKAGLDENQLLAHLEKLPGRIQHVIDCTARQVKELREPVEQFAEGLQRKYAAMRASDLVNRLLGIPTDNRQEGRDADDRSAGYPLRRFAEFGVLPGYEFPSEPASLRLRGDPHEEDPVTVVRRLGIGQFQPDAHVYARSKRWVVMGLDTASPWNPHGEGPTWSYRVCQVCGLRYNADQPRCPRCNTAAPGQALPSYEFAGFIARQDESPILDEEERYAERNLVNTHPQWDGDVVGRWTVGSNWALQLRHNEEVRWINEGRPPTVGDLEDGTLLLHSGAKGYLLCPSCGRILTSPPADQKAKGGRRNAKTGKGPNDNNGHAESCSLRGNNPQPVAISTSGRVEVLRLLVPVPITSQPCEWESWGLSLGYALINGMQHFFMLGAGELDFELEGLWQTGDATGRYSMLSLAFIDPSLGGSGYLPRIAEQFQAVAARAIEHLEHPGCETACYRCLKSYYNQRYHEQLAWPQIVPALEELAASAPKPRPRETGDIDDPRPWLEAYAAGVGSPLELAFLRLFEKHGFHPQKQIPVAPNPGEPPISVADFAVPERRLAIYIDGAAFHVGQRLRRDKFIRDRLRKGTPPWRVEELRAADLGRGAALVEGLK